jgi:hypothetical protein
VVDRLLPALLLGLIVTAAPAHGAFEWRAAWAAPYTLHVVESICTPMDRETLIVLAVATPFELPEVRFQSASLGNATGKTALHFGLLTAPGLKETHIGLGRQIPIGRSSRLTVGCRYFSVKAGGLPAGWELAATLLLHVSPRWLPGLSMTAGAVDQRCAGSVGRYALVSPLSLLRCQLKLKGVHLLCERLLIPYREAETSIVVAARFGSLAMCQSYRVGTGEAGIRFSIPAGPLILGIGRRWHPELGWTAGFTVGWFS